MCCAMLTESARLYQPYLGLLTVKVPEQVGCAGAFGGCLGVLAGSPIDVVRTRLQQSNQSHTGFFTLLHRTVSKEGPFALYRGLTYPLITAAAQNAVV